MGRGVCDHAPRPRFDHGGFLVFWLKRYCTAKRRTLKEKRGANDADDAGHVSQGWHVTTTTTAANTVTAIATCDRHHYHCRRCCSFHYYCQHCRRRRPSPLLLLLLVLLLQPPPSPLARRTSGRAAETQIACSKTHVLHHVLSQSPRFLCRLMTTTLMFFC